MLQTFVIALREGIEAFLIVAITLAYLRKTGRHALAPAVLWAAGLAVALSIAAAVTFREAVVTPLYEGILALVAALMVASMIAYMMRAAKHLRREIGQRIETAAQKPPLAAFLAVFAFTLLMITREGMETALMIASLMAQVGSRALVAGALLGTAGAGLLAWAWSHYGHRVNLARFFQVTSIFLALFVLQLVIYGFHEFTEAGALPLVDNAWWHIATEPYGPEGEYGQWLTYSMVIVPLAWLAYAWARDRGTLASASRPRPAS